MNISSHLTKSFLILFATFGIFIFAGSAYATHGRYMTISTSPINANTVSFTVKVGYRRTFFSPSVLVTGNFFQADDMDFGDGSPVITPTFTVTSFDAAADWVVGEATFSHTYPNGATQYTAFYGHRTGFDAGYGCCRIDGLNGVSNQDYRAETIVVTGQQNHSPTSSLPPIINLPVGVAATSFFVPASDFEGDRITFRLATIRESGLGVVQGNLAAITNNPPVIPGNPTINATTGQVTWNTVGLSTATSYAVQFMIEDHFPGVNGAVKSKTPVDVVMKPVQASGTGPTCFINGSPSPLNISVAPGTPISFIVSGTDPDSGVNGNPILPVTLNASGLPIGPTMTPGLPVTGPSGVSSTFNWTPTGANVGSYTISFSAQDNTFLTDLNSVTIVVNIQPPVITSPTNGYSSTNTSVPVSGTGNPGASVSFFNNGSPVGSPTTVNPSGNFSANVTFPYGPFVLTAKQTQNSLTSQPSNTVTGTIYHAASIAVAPATGTYEGPISLSATLTQDNAGVPVAGKTLNFFLNGSPAGSAVTGANGIANLATTLAGTGINVGSYPGGVTVSFATDSAYVAANGAAALTVNPASSTTTVTCSPKSVVYNGLAQTPCTVTVSGAGLTTSSPMPSYTSNINVGLVTASYSFAGDANHTSSSNSDTFNITKADAVCSISGFTGPFDGGPHGATGGCAGVAADPTAAGSSLNLGGSFTNVPGGSAHWTFTGGNNYSDLSGDASIVINKVSATISVNGYSGVFDANPHGATGSATGVAGADLSSGLDLGSSFTNVPGGTAYWTFTGGTNYNNAAGDAAIDISPAPSSTTVVCSPKFVVYTGAAQTPCVVTVSGVGLSTTHPAATYSNSVVVGTATASYDYVPDGNHSGSGGSDTFDITPASTSVIVLADDATYDGNTHGGSATAIGASLSVTVDVSYSGRNSTSYGPTLTPPTDAGEYTASASYGGDANHTGNSGAKDFAIGKATSTTTVMCAPGPFTYSGLAQTPCTAHATGDGGLNQPLTPDFADNTAAGTATASASFAGDPNHTGSSGSASFVIDKANATIVVNGFSGTFDNAAHGVVSSSVVGVNSETPTGLSIAGTTFVHVPGGTVHWSFTNANYYDQSGDAQVTITKANQLITFGALNDQSFGNSDFAISASASSGLPVHLEVTSGPCSLSGSNVHITGAGTCVIAATQGGNDDYNAAPPESRSFNIAKANQVINFAALPTKNVGDPPFAVSATGGGSGQPVTFTTSGNCTNSGATIQITGAGSCTVTAHQAGDANYNNAADVSQSFSIGKAPSSITVSVQPYTANGGSVAISGILTGVGGAPLAGQNVGFAIGSGTAVQICTAITGATGFATCSILGVNQLVGPTPVASGFGGNANYNASSAAGGTLVYAYAAGGGAAFAIGDRNSAVGTNVTFWGAQWANLNSLTGGAATNSFKGYANRSSTTPAGCGATWTTDPGNSSNPPAGIPGYMAVIVTSSVTKSGSTISGNTPKLVLVRTNSGYGPDPSRTGTGTVIATLCQ